jgi:hypothetical protein
VHSCTRPDGLHGFADEYWKTFVQYRLSEDSEMKVAFAWEVLWSFIFFSRLAIDGVHRRGS